MLKKLKEYPKEDKKVLAKVGILIILFLWPMLWTELYTEAKYDYDADNISIYDINVVLEFSQYEGEPIYISLELNATTKVDNPNKLFVQQMYGFLITDLNMTPSWSALKILFFVDTTAYESYRQIQCEWKVESTERFLTKSNKDFTFNGVDYVAFDPFIDNVMFKDDVPTRVEAYIRLYTG